MGIARTFFERLYSDYFRSSRLSAYEAILQNAVDLGYHFVTLRDYLQTKSQCISNNDKLILHRHDIDTDPGTARKFFEIEKKLGIKSTYYFRLSTLDIPLMIEIEAFGSEASYHYEELASFCKSRKIKSKTDALKSLERMRKLFSENFRFVETKLDKKLVTVCSHGDFVNRSLDLNNNVILSDLCLREELGIKAEAYDDNILCDFDLYVSDCSSQFETPERILDAIMSQKKIYLLTHPRQWYTNVKCNTTENLRRLYEGFKWVY